LPNFWWAWRVGSAGISLRELRPQRKFRIPFLKILCPQKSLLFLCNTTSHYKSSSPATCLFWNVCTYHCKHDSRQEKGSNWRQHIPGRWSLNPNKGGTKHGTMIIRCFWGHWHIARVQIRDGIRSENSRGESSRDAGRRQTDPASARPGRRRRGFGDAFVVRRPDPSLPDPSRSAGGLGKCESGREKCDIMDYVLWYGRTRTMWCDDRFWA